MIKTQIVTATEANRSFSKLLEAVRRGDRVEITSRGEKVAVLQPYEDEAKVRARQLAGLERLRKRWAEQEHVTVGPWSREDLYARD